MKYYTINNNKNVIYGGNVNDGINDIQEYYILQGDGSYRKFVEHDAQMDFKCFTALNNNTLQTFLSLEDASRRN